MKNYKKVKLKKDHQFALETVLELIRYYNTRNEPVPSQYTNNLLRLFELKKIPAYKFSNDKIADQINSEIERISAYKNAEYDILARLDQSTFESRIKATLDQFYSLSYSFLKYSNGALFNPNRSLEDLQKCHDLIFLYGSKSNDSIDGVLTDKNSDIQNFMHIRKYRMYEDHNDRLFRLYVITLLFA